MKNGALCVIAGLLALTSAAVIWIDCLVGSVYAGQKKALGQSVQAAPVPVLEPTPVPTRTPLVGDIGATGFPEEDTGVGADYSHQSDELRIAVKKVEEVGVTYFVADIWMRNISCFRTAFSSGKYRGKREEPDKIARDNNAILAVNGDFLGGLVIRNGELYRKATTRPVEEDSTDSTLPAESAELRPERATCVLYDDGRMATTEFEKFKTNRAMDAGAWQGWQFGPTLVRDGEAMKDVMAQGRSPRCMIGYYEPGHYCLVLIDGRQKGYSIGMNFKEMQELAISLGLKEAYNLDGGGSAVMTFNGEIISSPSGKGEARRLPDMVVIGEYLSAEQLRTPTPTATPKPTPSGAGQ